jgi:hypothetical protein
LPLAAALPTVVSASRAAMASATSFFFTMFPFPHRSGTQPESSRRGAAIILHSRTTPFLMFTRVHSSRAVPTHTAAAWAAHSTRCTSDSGRGAVKTYVGDYARRPAPTPSSNCHRLTLASL